MSFTGSEYQALYIFLRPPRAIEGYAHFANASNDTHDMMSVIPAVSSPLIFSGPSLRHVILQTFAKIHRPFQSNFDTLR